MLNCVTLVGRLVETPTLKKYDDNSCVANITLAVQRNYKNQDGEYVTDFIRCALWDVVATNTCDYCLKGDIVGVTGRLCVKSTEVHFDKEDEVLSKKINVIEVMVERVIFIHTSGQKVERQNGLAY